MSAKELLEKYRRNECTKDELMLLRNWYHDLDQNKDVDLTDEDIQAVNARSWAIIDRQTARKKIRLWPAIAAAVVLVFGIGLLYSAYKYKDKTNQISQPLADMAPGGNKAFLTLANGKRISLTDANEGNIANQNNVVIRKTADGKLVYAIDNGSIGIQNLTNTIETPAGGQYQITLPDGTFVMLNSSSSITFPISFASAHERQITLTGEGYFEVAKDKTKPFKVLTAVQEVLALGTHFNINAYQDEEVTVTSLTEGSVKVTRSDKTVKQLIPGEQAIVNDHEFTVAAIDVEGATAWQKGTLSFENESVEVVMRKIARWYNVDVVYKGNFNDIKLVGSVSKNKKLSEVLHVIQLSSKIKFKIEERRVTVMR